MPMIPFVVLFLSATRQRKKRTTTHVATLGAVRCSRHHQRTLCCLRTPHEIAGGLLQEHRRLAPRVARKSWELRARLWIESEDQGVYDASIPGSS